MTLFPIKFSKQRLEAFTDGVVAIIITIMVMSVPLPESLEWKNVWPFLISIFIYLLSFIVVGAFWNLHHRTFHYINKVSNKIIAGNFLFLFFLSLIPIFTKWVIENPGMLLPVVGYDVVYLLVSLCNISIFHYIIETGDHEEIAKMKQMRTSRKELRDAEGRPPLRTVWIRFVMMVGIIAGIILLSIHYPTFSTIVLMGIPVLFSLLNLFFQDFKPESRKSSE